MILRVVRVFGVVKTDGQGMVLGGRSYGYSDRLFPDRNARAARPPIKNSRADKGARREHLTASRADHYVVESSGSIE